MPVSVECSCGRKLKAKDEAAGRTANCPSCGNPVTFPTLESVQVVESPFPHIDLGGVTSKPSLPSPPPLPKAEWHYSQNGDRQGPITFQQLAAKTDLKPTDMVWKEGMPDWVPVASVSGLTASPAKPARPRKRIIAAVVAVLAVVGVVAALLTARPKREEPVFGGKPLSEWAAQLKDSSSETQRRAAEALGGIGWEAYPSAPDLMRVLNRTEDADTAVAVVDALFRITSDTVMSRMKGKQDYDAKVVAKAEIAKIVPALMAYKTHAYEMKTQAMGAINRSTGNSHEVEVDFIRQGRKWSQISDALEQKANTIKGITTP